MAGKQADVALVRKVASQQDSRRGRRERREDEWIHAETRRRGGAELQPWRMGLALDGQAIPRSDKTAAPPLFSSPRLRGSA